LQSTLGSKSQNKDGTYSAFQLLKQHRKKVEN